jgi:hypothetical protein
MCARRGGDMMKTIDDDNLKGSAVFGCVNTVCFYFVYLFWVLYDIMLYIMAML